MQVERNAELEPFVEAECKRRGIIHCSLYIHSNENNFSVNGWSIDGYYTINGILIPETIREVKFWDMKDGGIEWPKEIPAMWYYREHKYDGKRTISELVEMMPYDVIDSVLRYNRKQDFLKDLDFSNKS